MVEIGSQKVQHVGSGECWSLGSNQYPSGRFPKVSIGITVEKCPRMGSGEREKDTATLPTVGNVSSCQRKVVQENTRSSIAETSKGKRTEAKNQNASAWFSTRSVCHETPTTGIVQFYANRASVLQSDNGVLKKLDTVAYGKRREKGGSIERVEEVAFATMQETHMLDKGIGREQPEKVTKCNNEALRMKLWEILGTAPSQKKHAPNSSQPEENKENLNINQSSGNQKCKLARPKQNSDTIETDSEIPIQTMRRPITRSLTRKKAPTKTVQKLQCGISYGKKPLSSSRSDFKLKLEKKNIFAFDEGEGKAGSLGRTASGHSNWSKEKMNEHNKAKIEPQRIYFPRFVSEKSLQNNERKQTPVSPDNASLQSKEAEGTPCLPCQGKKEFLQTSNYFPNDLHHSQIDVQKHCDSPPLAYNSETHENTDTESPLLKKKAPSWENVNSPTVPKDSFLHEKIASPSLVRQADPFDDLQSPTLAMNATPTPRSVPQNEVYTQPRNLTRKIHISKFLDNSRSVSCGSDANIDSSDDTEEIDESREMESPHVEEKETALSPMEEQDSESFEADDFTSEGCMQSKKWFSNAGRPRKSPFTLHNKKTHRLKDVKLSRTKLSSPSPIGTSRTEETNGSHEAMDQYPEDSLASRSVAHLALVLERFRTKVKSHTSKKSSEILSAVADKIRLQLQEVESQIQADVGKLATVGKSKRKRLESSFQERQERLRLIHDKFKEEVNQHLLDCRSTIEELEAYHMELKGSADRQKASHRKLLLQVEEAMEAQLNDAETSITAIHKEARKKMNGLKNALKEWMEGD